jgi:hypothetical protein
MKIEHWHCQNRYEGQRLSYSNLLGACMGSEGKRETDQHCDTRKGDRDLSRNPANPTDRVEDVVQFTGDGRIVSNDPIFDAELNDVLNLNLAFLMDNRKATLTAFQAFLGRGELSRPSLEKLLRQWNGESDIGELPPFCQIVVYWLQKRLRRA